MMKLSSFLKVFTVLIVLVAFILYVGDSPLRAMKPARTKIVQTFVLDSFEKPGDWLAAFSPFFAKKYDKGKKMYMLDNTKCAAKVFDGKPWGIKSKEEKKVLAVKASFDRKSYNWVEVYPKIPLSIRGRCESIDVWVWGGNFRYRLEVHLKDYLGFKHVVNVGWLNYIGWRNLRIKVPLHIPQSENYIPKLKVLKFIKFVMWADPGERAEGFYVYFDRMQIQTDIYIERFDGDDLVKDGQKKGWIPKQQ